jgi:L1 cell adhesion molecule like protein
MDNEDFNIEITRSLFENLCSDLFKRCISSIDDCIKDSQISKEKIDEIILVGGSSRIPKIQQIIKDYF